MRIVHALFAILFMIFAFLQVNDPDPALWIVIYGTMALVCVLGIFEVYVKKLLLLLGIGFIAYCVILFPGVLEWLAQEDPSALFSETMKMEHPYIEESREFLGLVICLMVIVFYLVRASLKTNEKKQMH
jgi:hypothetical protein